MSLVDIYPQEIASVQSNLRMTREEMLAAVAGKKRFDVIVVGGGIHGAACARIAAFNGLATLLLERADYANATSSRSSKMAHGGIRYLQMGDLRQVFEGIRARDDLFLTADHLVSPAKFLLPVERGQCLQRWITSVGLSLYDFALRDKNLRHRYLSLEECNSKIFSSTQSKYRGFFLYTDGMMNDTRLVLENILAARQEGAHCLNYCDVLSVSQSASGAVGVGFRDQVASKNYEVSAGIVLNCAGPWVASVGKLSPGPLQERIVYSRGSHILFSGVWAERPVLFPLGGGRAYWVWPHPAGVLVGTTEREVEKAESDPLPSADEIEEILSRLQRDIPQAELTRDRAQYAFAGIRTLVRRSRAKSSALSRRHEWSYAQGVLTLLGGKFTTAYWTAFEGLRKVYRLAGMKGAPTSLQGRKLPGSGLGGERVSEFRKRGEAVGIPEPILQSAIRRYGSRSIELLELSTAREVLGEQILKAEVEYALEVEQAQCVEDIMRRRLELEYFPRHGVESLPEIAQILKKQFPEQKVDQEVQGYLSRMKKIEALLRTS